MKEDNKRYRNFSCVTYLNDEQLEAVYLRHFNQLRAYVYITHDKDIDENGNLKKKHIHLLVSKTSGSTLSAVKSWFLGYTDDDGNNINTFIQPLRDLSLGYDYLTHKNDNEKYVYDKADIKGHHIDFYENTEKQEEDTLTQALNDMFERVPLRVLYQRYGRDFIINYRSLRVLYEDIKFEERGGYDAGK